MENVTEVLSLIIAVIALVIAWRLNSLAKQANTLPILIDMFREFRSAEFKQHQSYVLESLKKEHNPIKRI